jgi:hypothetical protein
MNHSSLQRDRFTLTSLFCCLSLFVMSGCGTNEPPADLAPDAGLLAKIRTIQVTPASSRACPGAMIQASYEAVLEDGSRVPFESTYDSKHPPKLHVNALTFSSAEAVRNADGSWALSKDRLLTATTGFRLNAALKAKPAIQGTATVAPDYRCAPRAFSFVGAAGAQAQMGANGPEISVRMARGRSPFYDNLLVVAVQVGTRPPFYELYDAKALASADSLTIETRGGRGGVGINGSRGAPGRSAPTGCPSEVGAPGDNGGPGGLGAPGGRGGPVTIIVPADDPSMAALVIVHSSGGEGGPGGSGGLGGPGGKGGQGYEPMGGPSCQSARDGEPGLAGVPGRPGPEGPSGPKVEIDKVPADQVFGTPVPAELSALLASQKPRT